MALDLDFLKSVAKQMMSQPIVRVWEQTSQVRRTGSMRLRTVRFEMGGLEYQAIEQNREKPSRWGQLARQGHRVVQFRSVQSGRYVAVAVDDQIKEYGA